MRASLALFLAIAANLGSTNAKVTGKAEGFATGVTGGGNTPDVIPQTLQELVKYLGDSQPRNIVLTKTFDFTGSEGTAKSPGCAPWGTGSKCQTAISLSDDWCGREQPNAPKISSISYDKAGVNGIPVKSNKSLVGKGSAGIIRGKGLRIAGAQNVIIQNVHITGLNPRYVWGGDAITLDGTDMIWLDSITTSKIGRQHYVARNAVGRVTISNSDLDGRTDWSATCNNHHYWSLLLIGKTAQMTLKGNSFRGISGRGPKVGGGTVMHAVNNVWTDVVGNAFETESTVSILMEGNVFDGVKTPIKTGGGGKILAVNSASAGTACKSALGRDCVANSLSGAGALSGSDSSVPKLIKNPAKAVSASQAKSNVAASAGFGKL